MRLHPKLRITPGVSVIAEYGAETQLARAEAFPVLRVRSALFSNYSA